MSTWFPPLPGDQPNETIIPIGQTEDETPELPFCDYRDDFPDSDHVCDTDTCCECGGDHCCGSSRCPVSCPPTGLTCSNCTYLAIDGADLIEHHNLNHAQEG